ncbi:hypothetical protein V7201_03705 [Bacillus sp. JJ1122]
MNKRDRLFTAACLFTFVVVKGRSGEKTTVILKKSPSLKKLIPTVDIILHALGVIEFSMISSKFSPSTFVTIKKFHHKGFHSPAILVIKNSLLE